MKAALLIALVACGKSEHADQLEDFGKQQVKLAEDKAAAKQQALDQAKTGPTDTQPPAPTKPAPDKAQPALTVMMDGKPIAVQSVFAVRDSDDQIKITITNFEQKCEELTTRTSSRSSTKTDLDFTIRAGRYLHPDGALGWAIRGVYWHPPREHGSYTKQTEAESGGDPFPKELVLDAAAGAAFEIPLAIEMDMNDDDTKTKRTLSIKGKAKAVGCGDAKFKKDRVPLPEQPATITVATQKVPIRSAAFAVGKDGRRKLTLATHDVICVEGMDYASAKWPDIAVTLEWSKEGKLQSVARDGAWVPWESGQPGKLTATPNRAGAGAKEMTIALGGDTTIGGYPIALDGKVKATVCPTPK